MHKSMLKKLAITTSIITATACTTVQHAPLSSSSAEQLRGETLAVTKYETPSFGAMTAGKAMFGAIGGVAMIAAGNSIVKENDVQDPARKISQKLAEKLVTTRDMRLANGADKTASEDKIETLTTTYPDSKFLLDVSTLQWMFSYYPTDWAHYRITYMARLRLIDTASKRVIAESACTSTPVDDNNPPSKDQLLNNRAALLKKYLDQAAGGCIEVFARDVLVL